MDVVEQLGKFTFYLSGITLLIGIINFKKYWKTASMLIVVDLFLVFIIENLGLRINPNQWLYNILGVLDFGIIFTMFYMAIHGKKRKQIVLLTGLICAVYLMYDVLGNGIDEYWSKAFSIISLGISVIGVTFLLELATTDRILHLRRVLLYWVAIGLLVYNMVVLPITVLIHELEKIGNTFDMILIQHLATVAKYICFIIGFIYTQKKWNS